MIKAKKNKNSDSVKVDMKGNCSEIANEYIGVTQAFANMCAKECIPGALELLKKDVHENVDIAFKAAEATKREEGKKLKLKDEKLKLKKLMNF